MRPTEGIGPLGEADIVTVSNMLSDARTSCTIPHHPSLSEQCQLECAGYWLCLLKRRNVADILVTCGKRYPLDTPCQFEHIEFRPDLLADDDKDRL